MDNEIYDMIEETVYKIARETAGYYATGTCMWCGGHNRKVQYYPFERDGSFYVSLICKKCLEEVAEDDKLL